MIVIGPRPSFRPLTAARSWLPLAAAALALAVPRAARADDGWKEYRHKGNIVLERRPVPGASYYELRARVEVAATPRAVLDGIWGGLHGELPSTVKKRIILRESTDEAVFYDQIRTPIVSDRDYTLVMRREVDAATGAGRIAFETANQLGPPVDKNYVRMPMIRGLWTAAPSAAGTSLSYVIYSDPGGSLPAFMARGAQVDQVFIDVERAVARTATARR
jgi:hypothetical protein